MFTLSNVENRGGRVLNLMSSIDLVEWILLIYEITLSNVENRDGRVLNLMSIFDLVEWIMLKYVDSI